MTRRAGRHFLQIPGPTNVPDRVLRAIDFPTIDHRGPDFAAIGKDCLAGMKRVFKSTQGEVVIYPASGTGAWEAALANTLSPGDRVLMYETGHFATLWQKMATKLGLEVEFMPSDWRRGGSRSDREETARRHRGASRRLRGAQRNLDRRHLQNSRGQKGHRRGKHPALYMVDTISSLASIDYRHDEWGVDVTVAGSQKGLMLPPGLSFNCISPRALKASSTAKLPRSYWAWDEMIANGKTGYFPYAGDQPALRPARSAEDAARRRRARRGVRRHQRHAEATRRAVRAWGWRSSRSTRASTPARSRRC